MWSSNLSSLVQIAQLSAALRRVLSSAAATVQWVRTGDYNVKRVCVNTSSGTYRNYPIVTHGMAGRWLLQDYFSLPAVANLKFKE